MMIDKILADMAFGFGFGGFELGGQPRGGQAEGQLQRVGLEHLESRVMLTAAVNHVPTVAVSGLLGKQAYQAYALKMTLADVLAAAGAHDADGDALSVLITGATALGTMSVTHAGTVLPVILGQTVVFSGDTLTWTPAAGTLGVVPAFSVRATDGKALSAGTSQIFIRTNADQEVFITAPHGQASEASPGTLPGSFQINRTGTILSAPTTVTILLGGTAVDGTNFQLTDKNGTVTVGTDHTFTLTIPANQSQVVAHVVPIDDGVATFPLTVTATVLSDPAVAPTYRKSATLAGRTTVTIADSFPTVTIKANRNGITEGLAHQAAFLVTRTPALGGTLVGVDTIVQVAFSGTFSASGHGFATTQTIDFGTTGSTQQTIFIDGMTDNNHADGVQTLVATISPGTAPGFTPFHTVSTAQATVNVADGLPTVTIAANPAGITEGVAHSEGFTITRTAARGKSLAGVDTQVTLTFSGTFSATGHGFTTTRTIDLGGTGKAQHVVFISSTDDQLGNGATTLTATLSVPTGAGATPFNIGTPGNATVNVADAAPTLSFATVSAAATEGGSPGSFTITRTGGDINKNFTVPLVNSTGSGFGVIGTNFLMSANGQQVNNSVVIPAGQTMVTVVVRALDDFANDALKATIGLPTSGDFNAGSSSNASITLTNIDRAPVISQTSVSKLAQRNGTITLTFNDLVNLSEASLASGERGGALQLTLATIPIGTAQIIKAGTLTPSAAAAGATLSAGDTLIWTAPVNTAEKNAEIFTIGAVDGTVKSAATCSFKVTIL